MKFARSFFLFAAAFGMLASTAAAAAPAPVVVPMTAQNNSKENGSAVLTQVKGGVQVVISLKNAPADAQPSHIHTGACGNLKGVKYPLLNTVNGKSTTVVNGVTMKELLAGGYAINVHKSTSDLADYVSCGNIVAPK